VKNSQRFGLILARLDVQGDCLAEIVLWARAQGFITRNERTAPSPLLSQAAAADNTATAVAAQDNKPYPWADGVDLTGGLVQTHFGDTSIGVALFKRGDDWQIKDRGPFKLWLLRPAPHDFAVGDRVRVVSTAASKLPWASDEIGREFTITLIQPNNGHNPITGQNSETDYWWHPDDLMLLADAPAEQPDPDDVTACIEESTRRHAPAPQPRTVTIAEMTAMVEAEPCPCCGQRPAPQPTAAEMRAAVDRVCDSTDTTYDQVWQLLRAALDAQPDTNPYEDESCRLAWEGGNNAREDAALRAVYSKVVQQ
jgi:hypothetical protein